jgi:WD40 repeat protein
MPPAAGKSRIRRLLLPGIALGVAVGVATVLWLWSPALPRLTLADSGNCQPLCFSPDGAMLLARRPLDESGEIHLSLWDTTSGQPLDLLSAEDLPPFRYLRSTRFAPDGRLAFVDTAGTLCLRDLASGQVQATPVHDLKGYQVLGFSPDGRRLFTLDDGLNLKVWDVFDWRERAVVPFGDDAEFLGLALPHFACSRDGETVGFACSDGTVRVWDSNSGKGRPRLNAGGEESPDIEALAPGLTAAVSRANDRTVTLRDLTTGEWRVLFHAAQATEASSKFEDAAFSPDGQLLALGTVSTSHPKGFLADLCSYLHLINDSPDEYGEVKLFDVESGRRIATLPGCRVGVFSPDGRTFAACADNRTIQLWSVPPRMPAGIIAGFPAGAGLLVWATGWCIARRNRKR